ncbi:hypothetical protein CH268_09275 [Rhodococcus sp. 06-1460-1B]|nr:hypothetical protein CH268_09275 [Rhodococcus sp. 06-1460-1B]
MFLTGRKGRRAGPSSAEMTGLVCAASVVVYLALAVPTVASIALAAAIAAVLAVGSLRSMEWAWCVFFFALCANGVQVTVAGLSVRPEYFATPLFLLALHAHVRRNPSASVGNPLGPGLIVGGAGLIAVGLASSMVFALDPGASLRMAIQLLVALVAVVPLVTSALDLTFVVRSGTTILGAICVVSIAAFVLDPSTRIDGLAFEYNIMGCLCFGWLGIVYYFAGTPAVTKHVLVMTIPITIALILTSTRSAWIALVLLAVCVLFRCVKRYPTAVVSAVAAFTLVAFYLQDVYYRVGDEDTFLWRVVHVIDTQSGTGAYRVQLWNNAIDQIAARGWGASSFGTGLNTFSQFNPVDPTNTGPAYLSSMWLSLLYDVGFVGSAFFAVFAVALFLAARDKAHALPLFLGLAICTSVTSVIWFAFPWVFLALTATTPIRNAETHARTPASHGSPRRRRRHRLAGSR